jgi:hypothetical protein
MGSIEGFKVTKPVKQEKLRIDLRKHKITTQVNGYRFIDKDTKQAVTYLPAFELSGYGETFEKADEILRFSLKEYFDYLVKLPSGEIQIELAKLGWKKGLFNKEYSKTYVDENGVLQNLNAENDHVERIALTAA